MKNLFSRTFHFASTNWKAHIELQKKKTFVVLLNGNKY